MSVEQPVGEPLLQQVLRRLIDQKAAEVGFVGAFKPGRRNEVIRSHEIVICVAPATPIYQSQPLQEFAERLLETIPYYPRQQAGIYQNHLRIPRFRVSETCGYEEYAITQFPVETRLLAAFGLEPIPSLAAETKELERSIYIDVHSHSLLAEKALESKRMILISHTVPAWRNDLANGYYQSKWLDRLQQGDPDPFSARPPRLWEHITALAPHSRH